MNFWIIKMIILGDNFWALLFKLLLKTQFHANLTNCIIVLISHGHINLNVLNLSFVVITEKPKLDRFTSVDFEILHVKFSKYSV